MRYNATTAFKAAEAVCALLANKARAHNTNDNEAYALFMALKDAESKIKMLRLSLKHKWARDALATPEPREPRK